MTYLKTDRDVLSSSHDQPISKTFRSNKTHLHPMGNLPHNFAKKNIHIQLFLADAENQPAFFTDASNGFEYR